MYKPIKRSLQMNIPAEYYSCANEMVHGREQKVYNFVGVFRGHFKEKGGSETVINGLKLINKSITFTCWYDPQIKQSGRFNIYGQVYEITNIENVEMRNRYMTCTLESVEAGA